MGRRVALKCLGPKQSLVICSSVGGGKRVAWVDSQEWKRLILCVVVPFFVHSPSLTSLCTSDDDGASGSGSTFQARTRQLLKNVTADNSFLEHPELVKWKGAQGRRKGKQPAGKKHWEAVKRQRELRTVCIKPAARSKIHHGLVAQIVHASSANRALFSGDGDSADRQVVWWQNQGRIELRFDLRCTAILRAKRGQDSWKAVVRPGAGLEKCEANTCMMPAKPKPRQNPPHAVPCFAALQTQVKKETMRAQMKLSRLIMFMQQGYTGAWIARCQ
jgi:hypothetical protein